MNVQSDDVQNVWVEGPSYQGDNLHKRFWIKKIQNNSLAILQNKSGFLKYN